MNLGNFGNVLSNLGRTVSTAVQTAVKNPNVQAVAQSIQSGTSSLTKNLSSTGQSVLSNIAKLATSSSNPIAAAGVIATTAGKLVGGGLQKLFGGPSSSPSAASDLTVKVDNSDFFNYKNPDGSYNIGKIALHASVVGLLIGGIIYLTRR